MRYTNVPTRSRPRAAFARSLLWALPLVTAVAILCALLARERPTSPRETFSCVRVRSDRWNLLPGIEYTGRLRIELPPQNRGALTLIIGDAIPLDIEAQALDGTPIPLHLENVAPIEAPTDFWLEYGSPWLAPGRIVRATLYALPEGRRTVTVNLGRRAPRVLARLTGYGDAMRSRICAAPVRARRAFATGDDVAITPADSEYFATGWYGLETASASVGTVRWMNEHGALLVPSFRDGNVRIRLQAVRAALEDADESMLALSVNDVFIAGPVPLKGESAGYSWLVPSTAWLAGTNELLFRVSHAVQPMDRRGKDRRTIAMGLQRLDLRIEP